MTTPRQRLLQQSARAIRGLIECLDQVNVTVSMDEYLVIRDAVSNAREAIDAVEREVCHVP